MSLRLNDADRAAFLDQVFANLEKRGAPTPRTPFLEGLAVYYESHLQPGSNTRLTAPIRGMRTSP